MILYIRYLLWINKRKLNLKSLPVCYLERFDIFFFFVSVKHHFQTVELGSADSLTASPVSHRKRFQNFDRHFCPAWKQTEQHRREVCLCTRYSVFPFPSYLATHFSILYFYFLISLREQRHPPSISLWIICPRSSSPVWYHIPPVNALVVMRS